MMGRSGDGVARRPSAAAWFLVALLLPAGAAWGGVEYGARVVIEDRPAVERRATVDEIRVEVARMSATLDAVAARVERIERHLDAGGSR